MFETNDTIGKIDKTKAIAHFKHPFAATFRRSFHCEASHHCKSISSSDSVGPLLDAEGAT